MKISGVTILSVITSLGLTNAFAPTSQRSNQKATMELSMSNSPTSRLEFIQTASAATLISALTGAAGPANAAKYGSFGAGSPEVIDPKSAIIDKEILESTEVQNAISGIRTYLDAVTSMQADLSADGQADVGPTLRSKFDFVKLRTDLNLATTALDEDTQRGTDRIGRLIMQDITELEAANRQKDGIPRSEKRLEIMNRKLSKLSKAFSDYLAFYA